MVGGCRFAQAWAAASRTRTAAGCACAGPSWTEC